MFEPSQKVYRINDLEVQEVSLVDNPANQRKFLMVKNAGGGKRPEKPVPGSNFETPDRNKITTSQKGSDMGNEIDTEKTTEAVDEIMGDKAEEETSLTAKLHPDIQAKYGDALEKAGQRLLALSASVKSAKAFDTAEPKIPPKLMQEVVNIRAGLGGMIGKSDDLDDFDKAKEMADADKQKEKDDGKKPFPGAKQKDGDAEKGKPGMKKADELVAAIENLEKADYDGEMMGMLYMQAGKESLRMAMDACYEGDYMMAMKYSKMAYMMLAKYMTMMNRPEGGMMPMEMAEQLDQIGKALEPVAKAGKKMSDARFDELDKSLRQLLELAEQVRPGYLAELSGVSKSTGPATIQNLVDLVRKQDEEIKTLKGGGRPTTNAAPIGEGEQNKPCTWPADLNADYNGDDFPQDLRF